jgi:adenylylsulfate kinase-like enzyme
MEQQQKLLDQDLVKQQIHQELGFQAEEDKWHSQKQKKLE